MTDGIRIERTFPATPARVFEAWTDPAQFARWFGTSGVPVEDAEFDVRPGGAWSARMVLPEGAGEIAWHGTFTEVDPPSRLALTLTDQPDDDTGAPVTVDLDEVPDGTRMVFTQTGPGLTPEQYAQAETGWRGFFDDLQAGLPGQ